MRDINRRLLAEAVERFDRSLARGDASWKDSAPYIAGVAKAILDDPLESHWSSNLHNVADLVEWLEEQDRLPDEPVPGILEILDKPWHWDVEYSQMRGDVDDRPTDPSIGNVIELGRVRP